MSYLPSDGTLKVHLMVNGRAPGETAGLSAVFSVQECRRKGDVRQHVVRDVSSQDMTEWLSVSALARREVQGRRGAEIRCRSDATGLADFVKPVNAGVAGQPAGVSDRGPQTVDQTSPLRPDAEVPGPDVTYGRESLFPAQITSRKQRLLARPITLVVRQDGQELPVQDVP